MRLVPCVQTVSLLWYLLAIIAAYSLIARVRGAQCVPLFGSRRSEFDSCRTRLCLLFRAEQPYVLLNGGGVVEEQRPFPCRDRRALYPRLGGPFFQIIEAMSEIGDDALCIRVRQNCSSDDLVKFLASAASEGQYQFIAGGMLFVLPHRITEDSVPSASFQDGVLHVVGTPNYAAHATISDAFAAFRPFTSGAWAVVVLWIVLLLVLRTCIVSMFCPRPRTVRYMWWSMLGEWSAIQEYSNRQALVFDKENSSRLRFWSKMWRSHATVSIVFLMLFYEISVANHLFGARDKRPSVELSRMDGNDLSRFVVTGESGREYFLRTAARNLSSNRKLPWVQAEQLDDVYRFILDNEHPAQYTITYDLVWRSELSSRMACDKLVLCDTGPYPLTYSGAWYYGRFVNATIRDRINRRLLAIRQSGQIRHLHTEETDVDDRCGRQSASRVSPISLLFSLSLPVWPCLSLIVVDMLRRSAIRWVKSSSYVSDNSVPNAFRQ